MRKAVIMTTIFILMISAVSCKGKDIDERTVGVRGVVLPANQNADFRIESDVTDGYDVSGNVFTIRKAGCYDCYGNLYEGQLVVEAGEEEKIIINLNGCTITSSSASPVNILSADKVEISAKKETENQIFDIRTINEGEEVSGAAIYAECDLTLKGNGSLEVISEYDNGIQTKNDLKIKNLTLISEAVNDAIRGNDSVTVESGTVLAVSIQSDAIKTSSTDLNKSGEQRGAVTITGGTVELYAACDGIDSASDVVISGEAVLSVYTDEYSPYSGVVVANNNETESDGSDTSNPGEQPEDFNPGNKPGDFNPQDMQKDFAPQDMPEDFNPENKPDKKGNKEEFGIKPGNREQSEDFPDRKGGFGGSKVNKGGFGGMFGEGNEKLDYSCKGIKAGNEISISGGTIQVKSKDDGIHGDFQSVLESTGEKGAGIIRITGGDITIESGDDGIHADQDLYIKGGNIQVTDSYEGMEANRIFISDGSMKITAGDDALNANSKGAEAAYIEISGGFIDAEVPGGDTDTLDSNSTVRISGGTIFLKNGQMSGSSFTGGTFDVEKSISVTGGTIVAVGCIGEKISGSVYDASQKLDSGNYEIRDGRGTVLMEFALDTSYKGYIFYSEGFTEGETYRVYRDSREEFTFIK